MRMSGEMRGFAWTTETPSCTRVRVMVFFKRKFRSSSRCSRLFTRTVPELRREEQREDHQADDQAEILRLEELRSGLLFRHAGTLLGRCAAHGPRRRPARRALTRTPVLGVVLYFIFPCTFSSITRSCASFVQAL